METTLQAPKQSLFRIADDLNQMFAMLEDAEARIALDEAATIRSEIARIGSTELPKKVDGIAHFVKSGESDVMELEKVKDEAQARIRQIENRLAYVRGMVRQSIQALGLDPPLLRGYVKNISLREGRESLVIDDERQIPSNFKTFTLTVPGDVWEARIDNYGVYSITALEVKVSASVNKQAVKDALLRGEEVPGASLKQGEDIVVMRSNSQPTRPKPSLNGGTEE